MIDGKPGPTLQIDGLSCVRGDRVLFTNLNFGIEAGELLRIEGYNGSGKTTLLRALAGLEPSMSGTVHFQGNDWTHLPAYQRPVGYVFQDMRLFRHLNVEDNLRYGAKRRGVAERVVQDVIAAFDLGPLLARRTGSLSGGEARRVALGRALATQPKILFLDEPMVGLDTDRRAEVLPYITTAVDFFGLSVLYVSHSMFEMSLLADRILPIQDGVIGALADGPARFTLPIATAAHGMIGFDLGGQRFELLGDGQVGQMCELRPGSGSILSQNHPGTNTSSAVLPVRIHSVDPAQVELAGQVVSVPSAQGFKPGQDVWLICPQLRARMRSQN